MCSSSCASDRRQTPTKCGGLASREEVRASLRPFVVQRGIYRSVANVVDSLRGSSVKIGKIQRSLAWPLRKSNNLKQYSSARAYTEALAGDGGAVRHLVLRPAGAAGLGHGREGGDLRGARNAHLGVVSLHAASDLTESSRTSPQSLRSKRSTFRSLVGGHQMEKAYFRTTRQVKRRNCTSTMTT